MSQKLPKCYQCGGAFARRVAPPHHRKLRYEGVAHDVWVTGMPEWYCADCNLSVTDDEGDESLQAALRRHVGLLTPQQIKAGIKDLEITQEKFAERIRCAPESISRWLNGAVLQSRVYDCFMRVYFEFPEVRGALEEFSPQASFGETVVHAPSPDASKESLAGLGRIEQKATFSPAVNPAFFAAAQQAAASHEFWDVHAPGDQSMAVGSDSIKTLVGLLYRHSESVESHMRSSSNRLSGFDWNCIYREFA